MAPSRKVWPRQGRPRGRGVHASYLEARIESDVEGLALERLEADLGSDASVQRGVLEHTEAAAERGQPDEPRGFSALARSSRSATTARTARVSPLSERSLLRHLYMMLLRGAVLDGPPGWEYCRMIAEYRRITDQLARP